MCLYIRILRFSVATETAGEGWGAAASEDWRLEIGEGFAS